MYYPTLISSESHQRGDTPQKKKNISFYSIPFFLIYFLKNKNIYLKIYIFVQPISFSQPQRIYIDTQRKTICRLLIFIVDIFLHAFDCVCVYVQQRIIYNKIINNSHTYELCMFPFDWASAIYIYFKVGWFFKTNRARPNSYIFSLYIFDWI